MSNQWPALSNETSETIWVHFKWLTVRLFHHCQCQLCSRVTSLWLFQTNFNLSSVMHPLISSPYFLRHSILSSNSCSCTSLLLVFDTSFLKNLLMNELFTELHEYTAYPKYHEARKIQYTDNPPQNSWKLFAAFTLYLSNLYSNIIREKQNSANLP